jgi:hypothetical protein
MEHWDIDTYIKEIEPETLLSGLLFLYLASVQQDLSYYKKS